MSVVSGDTVTIIDGSSAHPLRLAHVRAPDIGSKNINEQTIASAAHYALTEKLGLTDGQQPTVAVQGMRLVDGVHEAELFVVSSSTHEEINVNNWMLEHRYGYDPATQPPPRDWVDYHARLSSVTL